MKKKTLSAAQILANLELPVIQNVQIVGTPLMLASNSGESVLRNSLIINTLH